MLHHEAVHHAAAVAFVVELCGDGLKLDAWTPDRKSEVIQAVGVGGEQEALNAGGTPVAVQSAEEYLPHLPLRAHVRLRRPARDDAILLPEPVGVVLESGVDLQVSHSDHVARDEPEV